MGQKGNHAMWPIIDFPGTVPSSFTIRVMRKIILLSTLVFLVSHKSFSQEIIYDTQPIPEYLKVSLRGVKYGHWNLTQDQVNYWVNNQNDIQVQMVFSIVE